MPPPSPPSPGADLELAATIPSRTVEMVRASERLGVHRQKESIAMSVADGAVAGLCTHGGLLIGVLIAPRLLPADQFGDMGRVGAAALSSITGLTTLNIIGMISLTGLLTHLCSAFFAGRARASRCVATWFWHFAGHAGMAAVLLLLVSASALLERPGPGRSLMLAATERRLTLIAAASSATLYLPLTVLARGVICAMVMTPPAFIGTRLTSTVGKFCLTAAAGAVMRACHFDSCAGMLFTFPLGLMLRDGGLMAAHVGPVVLIVAAAAIGNALGVFAMVALIRVASGVQPARPKIE